MDPDNITALVSVLAEAHHHGEEGTHSILGEAWSLITDPAHAITELFYSVLFDLLIIPATILVYKKVREPKLRKEIHKEIDEEHGIEH